MNLRPGYLTFGEGEGSGLRHLQADSHLIAWLETKGYDYDLITDQELHQEGLDSIRDYPVVCTGSHPEYHTDQTLKAIFKYTSNGMYTFAFFLIWIPGVLLQSKAALLAALFHHIYMENIVDLHIHNFSLILLFLN